MAMFPHSIIMAVNIG